MSLSPTMSSAASRNFSQIIPSTHGKRAPSLQTTNIGCSAIQGRVRLAPMHSVRPIFNAALRAEGTPGSLSYLERQLLVLGGWERFDVPAPRVAVIAESLLDESVDVCVGVHRIVVEEGELLDAGLLSQRQRLLVGRVAEPGVSLVFLTAVLGVVDEQVRVPAPGGHVLQRAVLVVRKERDLVIR